MTAAAPAIFSLGDRVRHPAKPEWGIGQVLSAQAVRDNGAASQRLQIRFDRAGLKTIATAFVQLRPVGDESDASASAGHAASDMPAAAREVDPFKTASVNDVARVMAAIPEDAVDPFATPLQRYRATLDLYRFTNAGASLLVWAAAQSGMPDPLSRFSRHELEEHFQRFAFARDQHLAKTDREARLADPAAATDLLAKAPEPARRALSRNNRRG